MNVMIDTNVVLDDILNRVPHSDAAREVIRLVTNETVAGYITASCLTDIFYIVSKYRGDSIARKVVRNLLATFSIVSVSGVECQIAIDCALSDFEDALVVVCAKKAALDYIVTNDKGILGNAGLGVLAVKPADFLYLLT